MSFPRVQGARILVVEDDGATRSVVCRYLQRLGAHVLGTEDAASALGHLRDSGIELVITDIGLPDSSGIRLLESVKAGWPSIPVIMMTGSHDAGIVIDALHGGADAYLMKPFGLLELEKRVAEALARRAEQRRKEAEHAELERRLRERDEEVHSLVVRAVRSLVQAVEARDLYTRGHSERVTENALILAEQYGGLDLEQIRLGAELHDIGKIGVPDAVLNKPGRLTTAEREKVEQHPIVGTTILRPLFDQPEILAMTLSHHERWDGSGYPQGLAGTAIPVPVRILSVADVLDAMTSSRAYRPALAWDVAVREIDAMRGTQLAPEMVDVFHDALPQLLQQHEQHLAQAAQLTVP